jgi:hypothetical protein
VVFLGVLEFAHHPDFGIRLDTVVLIVPDVFPVPAAIAIGVDYRAFVDIYRGGLRVIRSHEFDLLGFAIEQCGLVIE